MDSEKPALLTTNSITGELRRYEVDNEKELDDSIGCIDEHFHWIGRAKKNLNKARHAEHIRVMQAKALDYVETEGFQGSYSAVLLLMLGTSKYNGRLPLTNAQMGEKLGYSRQTVSRAIKHLIDNGMIFKGEHEGREALFFSSSAAQKGIAKFAGTNAIAKKHKAQSEVKAGLKLINGGKSSNNRKSA